MQHDDTLDAITSLAFDPLIVPIGAEKAYSFSTPIVLDEYAYKYTPTYAKLTTRLFIRAINSWQYKEYLIHRPLNRFDFIKRKLLATKGTPDLWDDVVIGTTQFNKISRLSRMYGASRKSLHELQGFRSNVHLEDDVLIADFQIHTQTPFYLRDKHMIEDVQRLKRQLDHKDFILAYIETGEMTKELNALVNAFNPPFSERFGFTNVTRSGRWSYKATMPTEHIQSLLKMLGLI